MFQEEAGIPALADSMERFLASEGQHRDVDLILVDDGSTDRTAELLKKLLLDRLGSRASLLSHASNQGLTAALSTGSQAARGDYVAWLDSDLTYNPELTSQLATALDRGADVAASSCYHPDGGVDGVQKWRLLLSSAASKLYRTLTRGQMHTYTSMVRAYRREVLAACMPRREGFLGVTEVLLRAIRAGYVVVEVPAVMRRRRNGQSKMRVLSVGIGHIKMMLAWLTHRL